MTEKPAPPIKWTRHQGGEFAFDHPQAGRIVEIVHPDGSRVVRLVGLVGGQPVQVDIERWRHATSAREACQAIYACVEEAHRRESLAPAQVRVGSGEGWRCIRRLMDGASAHDYSDTTFVETRAGLVRINMIAPPRVYPQARMILEALLRSIEFVEPGPASRA